MDKIGIMTFHGAHNYGSVLQAFATQRILSKLGFQNEIINYRLPNQKEYYNRFYSRKFGNKEFIKRLSTIPCLKQRKERSEKFEEFIRTRLRLSEKEYNNIEELRNADFDYSILLSGSDQVWNEHCRAEFLTEPRSSILGYYLDFGSDDLPRISFSSSIGTMTREELEKYKALLQRYSSLAVRETETAELLSSILDRKVECTLDPTLMLNSSEWDLKGNLKHSRKFILFYTMTQEYRRIYKFLKQIKKFADRNNLDVICISPFLTPYVPGIKMFLECGPEDFLSCIRNAELVITDSFHGTAFAVNFHIPFYSIIHPNSKDRRRIQLLSNLHLDDRLISIDQLSGINNYKCNFEESEKELERRRNSSYQYLRDALKHTSETT